MANIKRKKQIAEFAGEPGWIPAFAEDLSHLEIYKDQKRPRLISIDKAIDEVKNNKKLILKAGFDNEKIIRDFQSMKKKGIKFEESVLDNARDELGIPR